MRGRQKVVLQTHEDARLGGAANGTTAHLWQSVGDAPDQDWSISPGGPSAVKLSNSARSGASLSVVNAGTANGSVVQLWDDIGAADQGWIIVPVQTFDPTVRYMIVNQLWTTEAACRR